MFRRSRDWATRSDLTAAVEAIGEELRSHERRALDAHAGQRARLERTSRVKTVAALVLACALFTVSAMLMSSVTEQLDQQTNPGMIGVALTDQQNAEMPITVSAHFNASAKTGTEFTLAVSNWTIQTAGPISAIAYFCGAIREELELHNVGTGADIEVHNFDDLDDVVIESDSVLGLRTDCSYAVMEGNELQTLVAGTSKYKSATSAADQVSYTYPGISNLIAREQVGELTAWPIGADGSIEVTINNTPTDLELSVSRPLLPESGVSSWSTPTDNPGTVPGRYQLVGTLQSAEAESEWRLFLAGALAGLGGATLLWALDVGFNSLLSRRQAKAVSRRAV